MIKVMIADDNKFALDYLKELVRWNEYGFEIIATAIDGLEAWDTYMKKRPQLVIIDVQMPGMTGIEVAEKIRECDKNTMIIFLSNYDEFDYARSAINLSVYDYLLKQELNETLLKEKLLLIRQLIEKKQKTNRY